MARPHDSFHSHGRDIRARQDGLPPPHSHPTARAPTVTPSQRTGNTDGTLPRRGGRGGEADRPRAHTGTAVAAGRGNGDRTTTRVRRTRVSKLTAGTGREGPGERAPRTLHTHGVRLHRRGGRSHTRARSRAANRPPSSQHTHRAPAPGPAGPSPDSEGGGAGHSQRQRAGARPPPRGPADPSFHPTTAELGEGGQLSPRHAPTDGYDAATSAATARG